MSNVVRHGFSTLNRLLGKKNKNGSKDLSKSSTTLNRSSSNLAMDETSQLNNKIAPLAVNKNTPFEQTFRVTIQLPLEQLYVARVGAKTKLLDVLHMICTDKLLDPNKFEFKHPTDDTQIFDLDMTIGEVGLSEIRLAPKQINPVAMTVVEELKMRMQTKQLPIQSNGETRYMSNWRTNQQQRSHTFSASPYSSSNSLNSTDSSGQNSSIRSSMPAIPCRKKRAAPRPPSQNSIPEEKPSPIEAKMNALNNKKSNLMRQNFHVSSPNLTNGGTSALSISNFDDSRNNPINRSDSMCNERPQSMIVDEQQNGSRAHSRTSSDASDIARDGNESMPRRRLFTGKKKAPAPPPRISSSLSMAKTECENALRELDEELSKEEEMSVAQVEKAEQKSKEKIEEKSERIIEQQTNVANETQPMANASPNVTKVMLNVTEVAQTTENLSLTPEATENSRENETSPSAEHRIMKTISRTQINGEKPKSISVVELNVDHSLEANGKCELTTAERDEISKEVNEIIEEAVTKSEERLIEKAVEVEINAATETEHPDDELPPSPTWEYTLPAPPTPFADTKIDEDNKIDDYPDEKKIPSYANTECSDSSLPTSGVSTLEMHSTGPESLQTSSSDIEDGYKGNANKSPSPDDKIDDNKIGVIDELNTIINAKRLDSVIHRASEDEDLNDASAVNKRSTLSNFQICSYTKSNHQNVVTKYDTPQSVGDRHYRRFASNEERMDSECEAIRRAVTPKRVSLTNGLGVDVNELKAPKYVSRSKSFHSTMSWTAVRRANESPIQPMPTQDLTETSRQISASELCIADSPSLQSVKVLKSIMSSAQKLNENDVKIVRQETETKTQQNGEAKTNGVWKYQGPPAINFSTWGERPKSQVQIKSDNDYKFGRKVSVENGNANAHKLPVVKSVEYKKNVDVNAKSENVKVQLRSKRLTYEVARIVPEKSFSNGTMTLGRITSKNNETIPVNGFHGRDNVDAKTTKMTKPLVRLSTYEQEHARDEKPAFAQFTLRKTGLKERIIDEANNNNVSKIDHNGNGVDMKRHTIQTVPKAPPPPIAQKPKIDRPLSTTKAALRFDPRDQLLDSIRSFNRTMLKRS